MDSSRCVRVRFGQASSIPLYIDRDPKQTGFLFNLILAMVAVEICLLEAFQGKVNSYTNLFRHAGLRNPEGDF